jgi:two-component system response regulator YesN
MYKIAVFDDNPLVLKSITSTIDWNKLDCVIAGTAENGNDAYKILREKRVDIVISDIKMPGIDGLALVQKISGMGLHTKIILITGFHEFELARQAVHLGVFDMLTKPLSNDSIFTSVSRALEALKKEFDDQPEILSFNIPNDVSSLVRHAITHMNRHYTSDITLEIAAENLQVSPNHLSRVLKREIGLCFVEILTKIRMTEALKLLKRPNAKVYMVAEQVGYRDYAYFYQVFKRYFNISPQKYRNKFL